MDEQVAASAQNQALSALLFLYRKVLKQELGIGGCAAKLVVTNSFTKKRRLPIIGQLWGVSSTSGKTPGSWRLTEGCPLSLVTCNYKGQRTRDK